MFPGIFFRPLFNLFVKGHFENRLRRLRAELLLRDELSESTQSGLVGHIDAALERWKTPRFTTVFFTMVIPAILAIPTLAKPWIDIMGSLGIHMPTNAVEILISYVKVTVSPLLIILSYLILVPYTAFLAKRGLFIGREPNKICFPGGQADAGIYAQEKEILARIGLHTTEAPIDFWLCFLPLLLNALSIYLVFMSTQDAYWQLIAPDMNEHLKEMQMAILLILYLYMGVVFCFIIVVSIVAVFRRGKMGRA